MTKERLMRSFGNCNTNREDHVDFPYVLKFFPKCWALIGLVLDVLSILGSSWFCSWQLGSQRIDISECKVEFSSD